MFVTVKLDPLGGSADNTPLLIVKFAPTLIPPTVDVDATGRTYDDVDPIS